MNSKLKLQVDKYVNAVSDYFEVSNLEDFNKHNKDYITYPKQFLWYLLYHTWNNNYHLVAKYTNSDKFVVINEIKKLKESKLIDSDTVIVLNDISKLYTFLYR